MKKYTMLLSLVLAPVLLAGSQSASNFAPIAAPQDCDLYGRHPVLLVDVSGGTLLGPVHRHLAVYSDGSATLSSSVGQKPDVFVRAAQFTEQELNGLIGRVQSAGAFTLCDQAMLVADIPMTTVTVFGRGKTTRAHSFSYWMRTGEYAVIDAIVDAFMAAANFQ